MSAGLRTYKSSLANDAKNRQSGKNRRGHAANKRVSFGEAGAVAAFGKLSQLRSSYISGASVRSRASRKSGKSNEMSQNEFQDAISHIHESSTGRRPAPRPKPTVESPGGPRTSSSDTFESYGIGEHD